MYGCILWNFPTLTIPFGTPSNGESEKLSHMNGISALLSMVASLIILSAFFPLSVAGILVADTNSKALPSVLTTGLSITFPSVPNDFLDASDT